MVPMECSSHDNITSSITISNMPWELPGPPLNISIPVTSTTCLWTNGSVSEWPEYSTWYYNETEVNLTTIKANSRFVAADRYAWGFSASLILTFCVYTIMFATSLAVLQTEMYWNSRSDHMSRDQSLYGDIIFLVKGFKALLGNDVGIYLSKD